MKIIIDENILLANAFFGDFGELVKVPPRELTPSLVKAADALIVRSVAPINSHLLQGSAVKFVGTCTAGIDHFDTQFMDTNGIVWTGAPGCNAESVADYVFSSLATLNIDWWNKSFGIVAFGNVGSRIANRLIAIGISVKVYDPLVDQTHPVLSSLEDVLACDIISVHAPLTKKGAFPSFHLLDGNKIAAINSDSILISAGRGAVVDNIAVLHRLNKEPFRHTVFDVWENEPAIDIELMQMVDIATPHIAGHSYDGKVRGTEMIYQSFCQFLGVDADKSLQRLDPIESTPELRLKNGETTAINDLILQAYDAGEDSKRFKSKTIELSTRADEFDAQRKHYPVRREFSTFSVSLAAQCSSGNKKPNPELVRLIEGLGFSLKTD